VTRSAHSGQGFRRISVFSNPCFRVQEAGAGLKLAKNPKTAEKELGLQLFAMRQML
jgi:hypothetical protein